MQQIQFENTSKGQKWFLRSLVDQSLSTSEIRGSNLVIGNFITFNCNKTTKIKEKEAVNGQIIKQILQIAQLQHLTTEAIQIHLNLLET